MAVEMEALYNILSDEDGDYGYSVTWGTRLVRNEETGRYERVEDPSHVSFEIDGIDFTYMMKKARWSDEMYPMLLASWSVRTAIDDSKDYEEWVDPDVESIINMLKVIDYCGGRMEWIES